MHDSADQEPGRSKARRKTVFLWIFSIGIIVPGAYGFIDKFVLFIRTLNAEEGGGFTIIPIMNYLIMTAGFTCLLIWAACHGMFKDIERPKYTMLEREAMLEQSEERERRV